MALIALSKITGISNLLWAPFSSSSPSLAKDSTFKKGICFHEQTAIEGTLCNFCIIKSNQLHFKKPKPTLWALTGLHRAESIPDSTKIQIPAAPAATPNGHCPFSPCSRTGQTFICDSCRHNSVTQRWRGAPQAEAHETHKVIYREVFHIKAMFAFFPEIWGFQKAFTAFYGGW